MRRANSTMSSTLPSFAAPAQRLERAGVVAIVEHAEDIDIGIVLRLQRLDQLFAVLVGADDDGAAVEPALARPAAHHRAQKQPLRDQQAEADEEERRQPQPRHLAAELGEERRADEQQEHEGPGRDHPRHLPELAAEDLHFVDVGGLEADHRGRGHAENGRDIFPVKTRQRHHITEIERHADETEQEKIGDADDTGDHDRRIGALHLLVGDGKGCRRQPAAAFDRRPFRGRGGRGGGRGIQHRACVDRFHVPKSVSRTTM